MNQELQKDTSDSWMHYMRRGAFEEAWKINDADLQTRKGQPCWHWPRHFQYIWDGRSLAGKRVLVRCYHGLGDTIQFIRYADLLKEIAAEVIVWAQQPLIPVLEIIPTIDKLLPLHDGTPEVDYDVDLEIMELPHIFRTTLPTIPTRIPYLQVKPKQLQPNQEQLAVGLVWKAGDWDERRSIPFSALAPWSNIPGIQYYILQADAPAAGWVSQWGNYLGNMNLHDYAAVLKSLDVLISVDSMPAHLAGALGVPVWTLLQAEADWRWLENREDSPWYPTMRLFRQKEQGNWEDVIRQVTDALIHLKGGNG